MMALRKVGLRSSALITRSIATGEKVAVNVMKDGEDPVILADSEYPDFLWTLTVRRGALYAACMPARRQRGWRAPTHRSQPFLLLSLSLPHTHTPSHKSRTHDRRLMTTWRWARITCVLRAPRALRVVRSSQRSSAHRTNAPPPALALLLLPPPPPSISRATQMDDDDTKRYWQLVQRKAIQESNLARKA